MNPDERTLGDLAREVLDTQDACNLSGVVHSWSRAIKRLRELLERTEPFSTERLNTHPINKLWADNVAHLTGTQTLGHRAVMDAYVRVLKIAYED